MEGQSVFRILGDYISLLLIFAFIMGISDAETENIKKTLFGYPAHNCL